MAKTEWQKHLQTVFKQMRKEDSSASFKDAMIEAKKTYGRN